MKLENKILRDLQAFTKLYFKRKLPVVKWKEMKYDGKTIWGENKIYLNPQMREEFWKLDFGEVEYRPKTRLKLSEGEKYFQVLLHEIGHFKIKPKPSKEYIIARRQKNGSCVYVKVNII